MNRPVDLPTSSSTQSKGSAKWNSCWRQACYLSKYIYKDPPPTDGFKTNFPDKMAEVEKYWEAWQDKTIRPINDEYGLVAKLFKVKGANESNKQDICPPCLVFRGTDFDDFRGIAAFAPLRVALDWLSWTFFEGAFVRDKTLPSDVTRENLMAEGYEEALGFSETGTITLQGAPDGATIDIDVTISLYILTHKAGDWTSNIQQGRGLPSEQYSKAKSFSRDIVDNFIDPSEDKRLEISGHSLGGGLASASAAVLDNEYPELTIHAIVFNSAGVHSNTIQPAGVSDGLIDLFSLDDEILTTISNRIGTIPIIGSIFRLADRHINQFGLPETLGKEHQASPVIGSGDGLVKSKANPQGKYQYDKWSELPNLFPIDEQTLRPMPHPNGFPVITGLDNAMQNGSDVSQIGNAIVQFLVEYFGERVEVPPLPERRRWDPRRATDRLNQNITYYTNLFNLMRTEITPEIEALEDLIHASVDFHGMDFVIATYEKQFGPITGVPLDPKHRTGGEPQTRFA